MSSPERHFSFKYFPNNNFHLKEIIKIVQSKIHKGLAVGLPGIGEDQVGSRGTGLRHI